MADESLEARLRAEARSFEYHGSHASLRAAKVLLEAADAIAATQVWKEAVIDALVVSWLLDASNQDNPRKAISDLAQNVAQEALDPRISKAAHDLVETAKAEGAREAIARCAQYLQHRSFCQMNQPSLLMAGDGPNHCTCGLAALRASLPPDYTLAGSLAPTPSVKHTELRAKLQKICDLSSEQVKELLLTVANNITCSPNVGDLQRMARNDEIRAAFAEALRGVRSPEP